ncbi:YdeI/OmpD-associated family protein [Actinoplanes sp. M2I2]|uniref:YdeI/OmpD-associated family protein n=1 Tax=Actinoplanes sp. M2I2 TaxID=1734444 RepID=UPI0035B3BCBA
MVRAPARDGARAGRGLLEEGIRPRRPHPPSSDRAGALLRLDRQRRPQHRQGPLPGAVLDEAQTTLFQSEESAWQWFSSEESAWQWFSAQSPSYRRAAAHWVVSAKRADTRERRLTQLIADSAAGRKVPPLAPR